MFRKAAMLIFPFFLFIGCGRENSSHSGAAISSSAEKPNSVKYDPYHLGLRVDFRDPSLNAQISGFWNMADVEARWTTSNHSTLKLKLDTPLETKLVFMAGPFLAPGKLDKQIVEIRLNDKLLSTLNITNPVIQQHSVTVPANSWHGENVLAFDFPFAKSPLSLGAGADDRTLGLAIQWLEVDDSTPK